MQGRQLFERLSTAHAPPSGDALKEWLVSAEPDGLRLLTEEHDWVILYASFQCLLIISIFGQASKLVSPNKTELYNSNFYVDEAWCIQKSWGGGEGHRMYLESPLNFPEVHPLHNAEPIIFRRSFDGMPEYELLALDQMVVEGFVATEIRKIAVASGVKCEALWQSLKLIQEILRTKDSLTADQTIEPLKELHYLRSKVPSHSTGERTRLEAEAIRQHGSLTAHFHALCIRCQEAFDQVVETLRS